MQPEGAGLWLATAGVTHGVTGFVPCCDVSARGRRPRPGRRSWPDEELDPLALVASGVSHHSPAVLLVRGGPPSIIDFSPYWRAPSYAEGIVIADALCWHAATPRILKEVDVPVTAVARGLLFRVLTTSRVHPQHTAELRRQAQRYHSVVAALDL